MPTFPINPTATCSAAHRAAELYEAWRNAEAVVESIEDQFGAAKQALQTVQSNPDSTSAQIRKAADKVSEPWPARLQRARSKAAAAEHVYYRQLADGFDELHDEMRPEAEAVRQGVIEAADALSAAFGRYDDVRRRVEALARHAEHIDRSDVAAPKATKRRGLLRPERVSDPTGDLRTNLAEAPDAVLPVPVVADHALRWRRDRLDGVPVSPGRGLTSF